MLSGEYHTIGGNAVTIVVFSLSAPGFTGSVDCPFPETTLHFLGSLGKPVSSQLQLLAFPINRSCK